MVTDTLASEMNRKKERFVLSRYVSPMTYFYFQKPIVNFNLFLLKFKREKDTRKL